MTIENVQIFPLTPDRLADHLAFFDHDAFADNPRWAFCYCHCLYADHRKKPWAERTAAENRAAIIPLIQSRQMRGLLAYAQGKVVGWCGAGPKMLVPALHDTRGISESPLASDIGAITCFLVAPDARGQGIARQLLLAACDTMRRAGLSHAEGYPRRKASTPAANHHGPLALYLAAGFAIVSEDDDSYTVRMAL